MIKDVSDAFQHLGKDAVADLFKNKQRPFEPANPPKEEKKEADELPPIVCASDLLSTEPPEPPQLIKGLLHQGSKMVLGGGSKSYKTWSLLDLGMSVATGKPWWGFETTASRVLYINLELSDWSFSHRMNNIKAVRPELTPLRQLDVWNLRGRAVSFEKMRPKITEKLSQDYGLIIIDPIYKVYGNRDENSAGEMGALLNEIERLAVDTGAAVIFGAHFSKGNQAGKESIDRISGSGVFARDPDTILVMTKHETEDTFTVESTLRNFKPIPPFCVQRNHPLMERNDELDPTKLKRAGVKTEQYPVALLLKALGVDVLTTTEWKQRTCKETGMSERSFLAKLREIKEDDTKVTKNAEGKWKATSPIYPPGWKSERCENNGKEEVQECK